jgi:hypothetical protein
LSSFLVKADVRESLEKAFLCFRFRLHLAKQCVGGNFHNALQAMQERLVASVFVGGESVEFGKRGNALSEIDSFVGGGVCFHVFKIVFLARIARKKNNLFSVSAQEVLEIGKAFRGVEEREVFPFLSLQNEVLVFVSLEMLFDFIGEALFGFSFEDDLSG